MTVSDTNSARQAICLLWSRVWSISKGSSRWHRSENQFRSLGKRCLRCTNKQCLRMIIRITSRWGRLWKVQEIVERREIKGKRKDRCCQREITRTSTNCPLHFRSSTNCHLHSCSSTNCPLHFRSSTNCHLHSCISTKCPLHSCSSTKFPLHSLNNTNYHQLNCKCLKAIS